MPSPEFSRLLARAGLLALTTYSSRRQLYEIFVVNAASGHQQLVASTRINSHARWSPDGTEIAFLDGSCLMVVGRDGSRLGELACTGSNDQPSQGPVSSLLNRILWQDINFVDWSPDGSRLAVCIAVTEHQRIELWIVERASGAVTVAWAGEEGYRTYPKGAGWSPDWNRVGFSLRTKPPLEIWATRDFTGRLQSRD